MGRGMPKGMSPMLLASLLTPEAPAPENLALLT